MRFSTFAAFFSFALLAQAAPVKRAGVNENQINNACKDVTLIYARGTTEAGNVGTVAGPPLFRALRAALGDGAINVQGVDYPANVAGFSVGGDRAGSAKMASLINQAATQCPQTKIVLSGYSQGAQLVHNAAETLSAAVTARIAAVVNYGDPESGDAVGNIPANKVSDFCNRGDIICTKRGSLITHLLYGRDAAEAAAFIQGKI